MQPEKMSLSRKRRFTSEKEKRLESKRLCESLNKSWNHGNYMNTHECRSHGKYLNTQEKSFYCAPSSGSQYVASKSYDRHQHDRSTHIKRKYGLIRGKSYKLSRGNRFFRGRKSHSKIYHTRESKHKKVPKLAYNRTAFGYISATRASKPSEIEMSEMPVHVSKSGRVSDDRSEKSEEEEGQIREADEDGIDIIGEYEILSEISSDEDFDETEHNFRSGYSENDSSLPRPIEVLKRGHRIKEDTSVAHFAEEENNYGSKTRSLKSVPIRFTWTNCTQSERNEVAAKIMRIAMKHGGIINFDNLKGILYTRELVEFHDDLLNFLLSYQNNFEIVSSYDKPGHSRVKCKTNLQLCQAYLANANCDESCQALHACRFNILSCCEKGKSCTHEHRIKKMPHNKEILKRHFLQKLNFAMLRMLLRDPSNRSHTTVPKPCSHYNYQNGCKNSESCQYLHICKYKMYGKCKFGCKCKRSHDLFDPHNNKVLEKYGFEGKGDESLIGGLIKTMFSKSLQSNCHIDSKTGSSKLELDWEMDRHDYSASTADEKQNECMENKSIHEHDSRKEKEEKIVAFNDERKDIPASNRELHNGSSTFTWKLRVKPSNTQLKLSSQDIETLEQKYQEYRQSRFFTVQIEEKSYTLDFSTLDESKDRSDRDDGEQVIIKRVMKESANFIPLESH